MLTQSYRNFSGSIVALITPMTDSGEVDFEGLKSLVKWHLDNGTNGLVVLGTTAETAMLTKQEQHKIIETVIEVNNKQIPIIVGNGANCTRSTIENTQALEQFDIDGYLTVTPYYVKPSQKGMVAHFKAVAQATSRPIILYNVPGRTGVDINNDAVIKLMDVPNIIGIKDATGDVSRVSIMKQASPDFLLFSGDDHTSLAYLAAGGNGVITVTGNVEPKLMSQMVNCELSNDSEQAKLLDDKLAALHQDLFIEPNPVPAKWALQQKGVIKSDMVRLPLLPMEPIHQKVIKQALQQAQS